MAGLLPSGTRRRPWNGTWNGYAGSSESPRSLTLGELVEAYLEQHDVDPVTIEKLRWLLEGGRRLRRPAGRRAALAGDRRLANRPLPGYRFDATQALRQALSRAVLWGMIDVNPAKLGVDNPSPRRREQRPFESWAELDAVAANLVRRYRPMVIFAAATGLRPAEWLALERRDVDRRARVVDVRRSFTKGRLKCPKTEASRRAVPLQTIALDAIEQPAVESAAARCVFPAERGGYLDLHNFRNRDWKPANSPPLSSRDAGSTISAHLRHLRASCRDLHLRPLPLQGHQPDHDRPPLRPPRPRRTRACYPPARRVQGRARPRWTLVDAAWTSKPASVATPDNGSSWLSRGKPKPSDGLEPSTPSLPFWSRAYTLDHSRHTFSCKSAERALEDASRDVARVVSDVSVLCPRCGA